MNPQHWGPWIRSRPGLVMEVIRIYLGVGLFIKGVFFLMYPEELPSAEVGEALAPWIRLVPWIHLVGGAMLAVGWQARWAALFQLPVLLGAVFVVHWSRMTSLEAREGVEFSALVLFLMVLVLVKGPGELALPLKAKTRAASPGPPWQSWVDARADLFLDLIRIYLGFGLIVKGLYLMLNREEFLRLLDASSGATLFLSAAAHYVIPAHFAGGLLLVIGLLTRWAAAAQIPVLLGAILCVYLPRMDSMPLRQNLEFTMLVLTLVIILTAYGSGRFSTDHTLSKTDDSKEDNNVAVSKASHAG